MIFERRLKPQINVDLTPLIDVVFQLVIFFMISSTFNVAPGIEIDLPLSNSSESLEITEYRITIVSEEEIYVNKERTNYEGLSEILKQIPAKDRESLSVVIDGDKEVSYQLMVRVLDLLRLTGIEGASLITSSEPRT